MCKPGAMPGRKLFEVRFPILILILSVVIACGGDAEPESTPSSTGESSGSEPPAVECAPELGAPTAWRHDLRARAVLRLGSAHHSTQGPLVVVGSEIELRGKFAYGRFSKDLEDESVRAFVRTGECRWREVGTGLTDRDGRVTIRAGSLPRGLHDYRLVVSGDHTMARGVIAVLAPGSPIVVFDIDGTLTISDGEVFEEALLGSTPEIFEGAGAVVNHYVEQGVQPVYITGRTYHFQRATIDWLEGRGLARGPLHTTDSVSEALPGSNVEEYKQAFLEQIAELGFPVVAAYGNASSDVCAYARSGVATDHTYIVGPNAGTACEGHGATRALTSYALHLRELEAEQTDTSP